MRITAISDTHTQHKQVLKDLPGGDLLIHAGDIMSTGYYKEELFPFLNWYEGLKWYDHKVFIAGNHDRLIENDPVLFKDPFDFKGELTAYKTIDYLQDEEMELWEYEKDPIKIWGTPWQPAFNNWSFNLPRCGEELDEVWNKIPDDVDILITHGPPYGTLDNSGWERVGCERLAERLKTVKPKIHIFGHVHSGYGYKFDGDTHSFNASVLNHNYFYRNKPLTFDWDPNTNEIQFI